MPRHATETTIPLKLQENMVDAQYWTTCLNCNEWSQKNELCGRCNSRPPAEVIVHGCSEWLGLIPF